MMGKSLRNLMLVAVFACAMASFAVEGFGSMAPPPPPPPPPAVNTATVAFTLQNIPAGKKIAVIGFKLSLPQNVFPASVSGEDANGSITSLASTNQLWLYSSYNPATGALVVVATDATDHFAGFSGKYLTLRLSGPLTAPSSLIVSDVEAFDVTGSAIPGPWVTVSLVSGGVLPGDCDRNNTVTVSELQDALNLFRGAETAAPCVDLDGDERVGLGELLKAVNAFLGR